MKKIVLLLFLMTIQFCFSQDGDIDLSFHATDRGNGYGDGIGPFLGLGCLTMKLQPDGKILISIGSDQIYNGKFSKTFLRINPDGEVDSSFGQGLTGPMFGEVDSSLLLSDGKIIVGGNFTNYNGTAINRIARLNPNGTLDTAFNPGTGANGTINSIALLSNGKIVIAGSFTAYNGIQRNRIAVINEDGSLDMGFNPNSGADGTINTVAALSDGKILIAGSFNYYNVTSVPNAMARINSDGTIDTTFASPFLARSFRLLPDGKILINSNNSIKRLNTTGTIDNTFNYGIAEHPGSFYPLPDGKIITAVYYPNSALTYDDDETKLVRLNADGSLDNSFEMALGIVQGNFGGGVFSKFAIQPDGRLLVGGTFITCSGKVAYSIIRFNGNGTYDASFNGGTGADGEVQNILLLPDAKMVITGNFLEYDDVPCTTVKLNADGSIDTVLPVSFIANMASQSDGKILVGGNFHLTGNTTPYTLKRLNNDGTIDASFNFTLQSTVVSAIAVQPDGKILIAGTLGSSYDYKVVRLNTDGSVDTTFGQNLIANSAVRNIVIQADGKILLAGEFTTYGGIPAVKMIRLEANGAIDASFTIGSGFTNAPTNMTLQPDGKIVVIGDYPNFNGVERKIVRLNSNGTIDLSFDVGSGPSSPASTLALQQDGKVLVGGYFSSFNGQAESSLVRLNSNGSVDNSFNTVGGGSNNNIKKIVILPDGKPLIAGAFTNYNGYGRNRLARLNPVVLGTNEVTDAGKKVSIYPNPVKNILHMQYHTSIQSIAVFDLLGKMVMHKDVNADELQLDMSALNSALYFIKVITADGIQNFKIIKE